MKKSKNVGAGLVSARKGNRGITLIALIITIIVMLILVAVSIQIALNTGLFDATGKATQKWETAQDEEQQLAGGQVNIGGTIYESIDYYTKLQEGMVARIGTTYYKTLQEAIDAVPEDNTETTIVLLVDILENVEISINKTIILELEGNTVKNAGDSSVINLLGTLSIKNGTIIADYTTKCATININENATLNLEKTNVSRNSEDSVSFETITVSGKLNINSAKITSTNSNVIYSENPNSTINITGDSEIIGESDDYSTICTKGDLAVDSGVISATKNIAIYKADETDEAWTPSGSVVISGDAVVSSLEYYAINIEEAYLYIRDEAYITSGASHCTISQIFSGDAVISGGKIENTGSGTVFDNNYYYGTITIEGDAEIISTGRACIDAWYTGVDLKINGGTISNISETYEDSCVIYGGCSNIEISGGELSTDNEAVIWIDSRESRLSVTGGKIIATNGSAIWNLSNGIIEIGENAKISATKYALYNAPSSANEVTISGGEIISTGTESTIYNFLKGTLKITGGTISSTTAEYTLFNDGGTVEQTGGTIIGNTNLE